MTIDSPVQLSLGISLRDESTFSNFYAHGDTNTLALKVLASLANGEEISNHLIWGAPGCGLTHLLQAACHAAYFSERSVQYLPMRDFMGYAAADICEGLEEVDLVCIDGVDVVCGSREWEQAFFHLFNRMKDAGKTLLLSSHTSPPSLPILLPDLKSRVLGSVTYHIESLGDEGKAQAIIRRGAGRGINIPEEVARYILERASRDTNELFELLDRLDDASLQQQRKVTIPFVKAILRL